MTGLLTFVAYVLFVFGGREDENAICATEGPVMPFEDGLLCLLGSCVADERNGAVPPLRELELLDFAKLGEGLSYVLLLSIGPHPAYVDA